MFLEEVISLTEKRVRESKEVTAAERLWKKCSDRAAAPSFSKALARKNGEGIRVIAEIKRMSPSRGPIRPDLVLEEVVREYAAGGASAVSVLTEPFFFGGSLADIARARRASDLPILRKDFVIDPYQLLESAAAGAAAVLLIAAALDAARLKSLASEARRLGLEPLVEVHDRGELEAALEAEADVIGVNNRDLKTLQVDMATTLELAPLVPEGKVLVSESGYSSRKEVREALACGVDAILVGEALLREACPRVSLKRLMEDKDDVY
jgi:indole-3-glycerol phosphate synthase